MTWFEYSMRDQRQCLEIILFVEHTFNKYLSAHYIPGFVLNVGCKMGRKKIKPTVATAEVRSLL